MTDQNSIHSFSSIWPSSSCGRDVTRLTFPRDLHQFCHMRKRRKKSTQRRDILGSMTNFVFSRQEVEEMAGSIDPKVIQTKSFATRAAAYYVQGLKSFFQDHFPEAKRYLRETLKMANAEDLNRLTSCSLVLLGHLFMSSGMFSFPVAS